MSPVDLGDATDGPGSEDIISNITAGENYMYTPDTSDSEIADMTNFVVGRKDDPAFQKAFLSMSDRRSDDKLTTPAAEVVINAFRELNDNSETRQASLGEATSSFLGAPFGARAKAVELPNVCCLCCLVALRLRGCFDCSDSAVMPLCHCASVPCPRENRDCKAGPSSLWEARRVAFEHPRGACGGSLRT